MCCLVCSVSSAMYIVICVLCAVNRVMYTTLGAGLRGSSVEQVAHVTEAREEKQ